MSLWCTFRIWGHNLFDSRDPFAIALLAFVCGAMSVGGIFAGHVFPQHSTLGFFLAVMFFYFFAEYILSVHFEPSQATTDAFLINHSREQTVAHICSLAEYSLVSLFVPGIRWAAFRLLGGSLMLAGLALRLAARITAGLAFTHHIQESRREGHHLIRHGLYKYMRHPGYAGWLLYVVGGQLMMGNLLCTVAFAVVGWRFFAMRIPYEEHTLVSLFGEAYVEYRRRTPSGVPFIA